MSQHTPSPLRELRPARSTVAAARRAPTAGTDAIYAQLRHAIELVPFDVLTELVGGADWCEDWFPCPHCQRGSPVPTCSAYGDAFRWTCHGCGRSGSRRTFEQILLDGTTIDGAADLLATIEAVAR